MKKKLPSNGLLYLILDKQAADSLGIDILNLAKELAGSDLDLIQLRAKKIDDFEFLKLAKKLSPLFKKNKKLFIINDRPDLAYLSRASGLHLGNSDIPIKDAKTLLKKGKIIGKTIHCLKELKNTDQAAVNYLALGPFFKSKTKTNNRPPLRKNEIIQITKKTKKVLFAIGGINRYNVGSVLRYGIKNIAVSSAILSSSNPIYEIKEIKKCLKKAS
ncbi:MAG: thiamine phosphate synthase [Candidatus Omnitrophica bacterium]|nr:thiamine phosphate synthase [Candidatus Omnitrophota bacterium]MCF7895147.1 thiamine phosphate synthase [Candidatus Omnitrophota bacterium]